MYAVSGRVLAFRKFVVAKSNTRNIEMRPCLVLFGEIFEELCSTDCAGDGFSAVVLNIGNITFDIWLVGIPKRKLPQAFTNCIARRLQLLRNLRIIGKERGTFVTKSTDA